MQICVIIDCKLCRVYIYTGDGWSWCSKPKQPNPEGVPALVRAANPSFIAASYVQFIAYLPLLACCPTYMQLCWNHRCNRTSDPCCT